MLPSPKRLSRVGRASRLPTGRDLADRPKIMHARIVFARFRVAEHDARSHSIDRGKSSDRTPTRTRVYVALLVEVKKTG